MLVNKPIIGIPIGDPAGIGPEIVLKALNNKWIYDICKPLVVGDIGVLQRIGGIIGSELELYRIDGPEQGKYCYGSVDVISLGNIDAEALEFGKVQAAAGKAAFEYIVKAAELANSGKITAIATTPINKEAIKAAGVNFIGHTEMLAELANAKDPLTMFQVNNLRVFFLSRHVSLRKACDMVTADRIIDYVLRCDEALRRLGLNERRIAIAGLNPHSGEHGMFGDEEVREIEPAVNKLREKGIDVTGPVSADSVFYLALKGKYDAVLSLYHDQGHIATKTLDFERTISLTIGMPFLRTSVDHGTAFDIAGRGIASSVSMEEAIRLAAEYGPGYHKS
ncbi:4-hydroxythreonine-4-phosphate dehydrogenase PdxA [Pseudoclostridium thermosuccinogenes]|uniref:4-hydroxythreonine-4-phosphate dehydrogenase PdxA n=1 Tax=Clostridium thermosuccinogenes TaxID=84032 RepID=UPI002FD9F326